MRTEDEVKKKQARRQKREKEKGKKKGEEETDEVHDGEEKGVELVDLFTPYLVVRASGKIRSFSFVDEERGPKGGVQVHFILFLTPGASC